MTAFKQGARQRGQNSKISLAEREELLELYEMILLIRRCEERLAKLFADSEVPGFIHLSIGQEAVSAGVMRALGTADTIASTHRGHGHALAKGLPLEGFFAELLARDEGLCRGRGGSMHVADFSIGMLGANGIVGAGLSIALGSALSHKILKRDAVAVAFFGDGALAEGLLHETLNLAKLWELPMLFVCENNGWSEFVPSHTQLTFNFAGLCAAYGIEHVAVDGNDVTAVTRASKACVAKVRSGNGPMALECRTDRVRGHFEGDSQKYRGADELAGLADKDPVTLTRAALLAIDELPEVLDRMSASVNERVENAVTAARNGSDPDFETARGDVYTSTTSS